MGTGVPPGLQSRVFLLKSRKVSSTLTRLRKKGWSPAWLLAQPAERDSDAPPLFKKPPHRKDPIPGISTVSLRSYFPLKHHKLHFFHLNLNSRKKTKLNLHQFFIFHI
jgi:hypothetical protein